MYKSLNNLNPGHTYANFQKHNANIRITVIWWDYLLQSWYRVIEGISSMERFASIFKSSSKMKYWLCLCGMSIKQCNKEKFNCITADTWNHGETDFTSVYYALLIIALDTACIWMLHWNQRSALFSRVPFYHA